MLFKLSISALKSKSKDYIILLSGLIIAISIFYMFQTLGANEAFLKGNTAISSILFIFKAGSFLVGIVTFFYILYANSFLFSLRQREFGMYMMLGAKKSKIATLMFMETVILGIISLIIGSIIGIGVSQITGQLLMTQLDFDAAGYHAFHLPALKATYIFFLIVFFLNAIINTIKLSSISVLQLVHGNSKIDRVNIGGIKTILIAVFAIVLLAIGYVSMIYMSELKIIGIILALITVTLGTYMLFGAFLPLIMKRIKNNKKLNEKGINAFTFAQLNYRINNLTKILATITMLVALGAGAISGGMAFKNNIPFQLDKYSYYDLSIHNPTVEEKNILKDITFTEKKEYRYKVDNQFVYYVKEDLEKNPLLIKDEQKDDELIRISEELPLNSVLGENIEYGPNMIEIPQNWKAVLGTIVPEYVYLDLNRPIKIVDKKMYDAILEKENIALVGKSDNYLKYVKEWKQLNELQLIKYEKLVNELEETVGNGKSLMLESTKHYYYTLYSGFVNGILFMAFFLGIAFLTMMASCLMFKILSGASSDITRYQMLRKIGVRREVLTKSIYKELFLVFLFPAIVGIVHVLVGMNIFADFLVNPYLNIWIPISVFIIIYGVYYFITVQMYKRIVLPKES
ncbi:MULTISPECIES: FtsX-like permease family protein [Bacillus cereus group]|uniref:FtsX-like permease family protein n=1 Tax=Bacillus cereus group TaxID=86661 RepID=UPI0011A54251|nr:MULTISPECIES: FtsX-like permease family protein [Bacillus cereus group]MBR9656187.1 ABC transporter permease [Bacillus cereus]MCU4901239.1 FtsX-like permease family protein [Bacillus cereus]MCU5315748.1 FtsX-like permease family protein [Bacillus cereus]MCU5441707.1 FtsX-like permease family protein [Bacillus cereus]MEC4696445.1 FtsX-like permease family protein [Bacillus anthracis]